MEILSLPSWSSPPKSETVSLLSCGFRVFTCLVLLVVSLYTSSLDSS